MRLVRYDLPEAVLNVKRVYEFVWYRYPDLVAYCDHCGPDGRCQHAPGCVTSVLQSLRGHTR